MNAKKFFGWLLRIPLILLNMGGIAAGVYAAQNKINDITYAVPIILVVMFLLYIWGSFLVKKGKEDEQVETSTQDSVDTYSSK